MTRRSEWYACFSVLHLPATAGQPVVKLPRPRSLIHTLSGPPVAAPGVMVGAGRRAPGGIQGSRVREVTARAGVCTRARRQVACASARARASTPSSSSRRPSSSRSSSSRSSPTATRWRGARRSTHRGRGRRACSRYASKSSSSCSLPRSPPRSSPTASSSRASLTCATHGVYGVSSTSTWSGWRPWCVDADPIPVCDCSYVQLIWHMRACATAHCV